MVGANGVTCSGDNCVIPALAAAIAHGDVDRDRHAAAFSRDNIESSSHLFGAPTDAQQTIALAYKSVRHVKTFAVIAETQRETPGFRAEIAVHAGRARVAGDVVHAFLEY